MCVWVVISPVYKVLWDSWGSLQRAMFCKDSLLIDDFGNSTWRYRLVSRDGSGVSWCKCNRWARRPTWSIEVVALGQNLHWCHLEYSSWGSRTYFLHSPASAKSSAHNIQSSMMEALQVVECLPRIVLQVLELAFLSTQTRKVLNGSLLSGEATWCVLPQHQEEHPWSRNTKWK